MQRAKRAQLAITLFPFMDVLTGVIGVLMLIICALALLGLNQSTIVFDMTNAMKDGHPIFIECLDDRIIVYNEDEFEILLGDNPQRTLSETVNQLSRLKRSHRFVLAVRPSGVATYDRLEQLLIGADLRYGYEPMPANQKIRIKKRSLT